MDILRVMFSRLINVYTLNDFDLLLSTCERLRPSWCFYLCIAHDAFWTVYARF